MNRTELNLPQLDLHVERVANFQETIQHKVDSSIQAVIARGFQKKEVEPEYTPAMLSVDAQREFPVDAAVNDFSRFDMHPQRLYLAESVGSLACESLTFSPMITTRKRSAHGVFFGTLQSDKASIEVAVKPHETEDYVKTCLKDYISNIFVKELGLPCLPPVGFIIDSNRAYSLTQLDRRLTTLDSIDWTHLYPNPADNPGMLHILSQLSRQAALLHSYGIASHGDMAGRNAAVREDDTAFWIDWEYLIVKSCEQPDAETRLGLSMADIAAFAESLCLPADAVNKSGLGAFMGADDWYTAFRDVFFTEYRSMRESFAEEPGVSIEERNNILIELDVLGHRLKELITVIQKTVKDNK